MTWGLISPQSKDYFESEKNVNREMLLLNWDTEINIPNIKVYVLIIFCLHIPQFLFFFYSVL